MINNTSSYTVYVVKFVVSLTSLIRHDKVLHALLKEFQKSAARIWLSITKIGLCNYYAVDFFWHIGRNFFSPGLYCYCKCQVNGLTHGNSVKIYPLPNMYFPFYCVNYKVWLNIFFWCQMVALVKPKLKCNNCRFLTVW